MKNCLITFRSVTPAQRGEAALRRAGMECTIQRTPRWMEEKGCGYCLRVRCADIAQSADVLKRSGIAFRRIYRLLKDGKLEEVVL